MRWKGLRKSTNVNDQRGRSGGRSSFGGAGGAGLIRLLFSKTGIIVIAVVLLFSWIAGVNPLSFFMDTGSGGVGMDQSAPYEPSAKEEEMADFTKAVLGNTEDVWNQLLDGYREPTLTLFTDQVQSACGGASSASGPFYCSTDEMVYIDLSFFDEMSAKLGAPGDFAQAYVIAHEVGHHVQHLLGISDKVLAQRSQLSEEKFNKLSVRLELQADFLAGVWAYHAQNMNNIIEPGDFDEALNAASAIGDDRLQKKFQGRVVPDAFTHGTSAQRVRWFRKGYETGDIKQGDTFNTNDL
ncbi:MAG: neutral zinc metallopeptidase [Cyclobacteriaceae bacterium]|nr:neutral zinc metallopeptidase [Cyclobacteriaceae bacterium]